MNRKKVDIVVTAYNVEKYIDRFLESLLNQDFSDYCMIIVDDASTDHTFLRIQDYRSLFADRLIVVRNEKNLGLSESRNVGLDYIQEEPADYITFLDADDWIERKYLSDLYYGARKENVDICVAGVIRNDEISGKIICTEMVNYPKEKIVGSGRYNEFAYINPCVYSKIYKYELCKNIRFREIKRSEDTCFLMELLPRCNSVGYTNNAYYHYMVRGGSLSGRMGNEAYVSMHEVFAFLYKQFNEVEELRPLVDVLVSQIFIRSSIGGVCRLSFKNMSKVIDNSNIELKYLDSFIPNWRNNRFLNFWKVDKGSFKKIGIAICASMYKFHVFPIFVFAYYLFNQVLKKDVRM